MNNLVSLANPRSLSLLWTVLVLTASASCGLAGGETELGIEFADPVSFEDQDRRDYVAQPGVLSDGSLRFMRVRLPDGTRLTLPGLVSASGVRYGDGGRFQWWEHQSEVMFEFLDSETGERRQIRLSRADESALSQPSPDSSGADR